MFSLHVQSIVIKPIIMGIPDIPIPVKDYTVYTGCRLLGILPGALAMVVTVAAHEVGLPLGEGDRVDILELVDGLRHGAPAADLGVQPHPVHCLGVSPVHY